eukprot:6281-Chlamydomonas_euryale.AAC.5
MPVFSAVRQKGIKQRAERCHTGHATAPNRPETPIMLKGRLPRADMPNAGQYGAAVKRESLLHQKRQTIHARQLPPRAAAGHVAIAFWTASRPDPLQPEALSGPTFPHFHTQH